MDLYDTTSDGDRPLRAELTGLLRRYEAIAKFLVAMALALGVGFGVRVIFENNLGQVFGAMLVWFSLIFGVLGVLFIAAFAIKARVASYRRA